MGKGKGNRPKRLFKSPDRVSSYQHDRSPMARMKRAARDHEDVLQSIEFVLVKGATDDPEVDDKAVALALRACLVGKDADNPRADRLVRQLRELRQTRAGLSDDAWRESLRVVLESVDRHSSYEPGETSYLDFAGEFFE